MKKFLVFGVIVALLIFFTVPSMLFSETGDEYEWSGTEDGQYTLDIEDPDDGDDEPDTDVFCIDDEVTLDYGDDAYTETDTMVSDELQTEGGNFDGPPLDETSAEAVEIIATTATGGTNEDNQDAVWDIIEGDSSPSGSEVEKIVDAVMTIADGFVSSGQNVNGDDGSSLQDYLDEENINEVVVTLDDSELVDENGDYNEFEATAIMENPLVPEVTDQGKIVYWYILEDSYNVSFSETDLVTETTSVMTDKVDAEGGEDEDSDGRDEADDHYGEATIPYYFYWWGEGFPEFEEMNAEIGACVDIDEDGEIDKEDIGAEGETDLDEFVENMKVVKTIENPEYDDSQDPGPYNSEHKVEIVMDDKGTPDTEDDEPVINPDTGYPQVETKTPDNVDIDLRNAGKVLTAEPEIEYEYGSMVEFMMPNYVEVGSWKYATHVKWGGTGSWRGYWGWVFINKLENQPYADSVYVPYGSECVQVPYDYYYETGYDLYFVPSGAYYYLDRHYASETRYIEVCPEYDGPQEISRTEYQRFAIESYSEPCDIDSQFYSAWGSFELEKLDSETGDPIEGAQFTLTYQSGQTYEPSVTVYNITTGADGKVSIADLPWGTWELEEVAPVAGYFPNETKYDIYIGGTALFGDSTEASLEASETVENDPFGSITVNKSGLMPCDQATFSLSGPEGDAGDWDDKTIGNESATWDQLPYGTYTITESYPGGNTYYYTSSLGDDNESDDIVLDENDEDPSIDVVNTPEMGKIIICKTFTGNTEPPEFFNFVVYEGTDTITLKKGAGHESVTPLPGQEGRCTISGHRTTYGAPFNRVDELEEGDLIYLETLDGDRYVYAVTSLEIVKPTDVWILEGTKKEELLLTTCHPKYSAATRLIVISELVELFPF
jgi:LPXTG-site transpeptidase (sortase) family protein